AIFKTRSKVQGQRPPPGTCSGCNRRVEILLNCPAAQRGGGGAYWSGGLITLFTSSVRALSPSAPKRHPSVLLAPPTCRESCRTFCCLRPTWPVTHQLSGSVFPCA